MLRTLLATLLVTLIPAIATAQSADAPAPKPPPKPIQRSLAVWPDHRYGQTYATNMDIVTLASPTVRQHCSLGKLTDDTITCKSPHHLPPQVFQRGDILALIAPPSHENFINFVEVGAVVAAVLIPSFFVPFGWALTLRILDGFIFYLGWGTAGEYADDNITDHNHDILLYQRPDTTLTVHLR
jgi:hypothetical protein